MYQKSSTDFEQMKIVPISPKPNQSLSKYRESLDQKGNPMKSSITTTPSKYYQPLTEDHKFYDQKRNPMNSSNTSPKHNDDQKILNYQQKLNAPQKLNEPQCVSALRVPPKVQEYPQYQYCSPKPIQNQDNIHEQGNEIKNPQIQSNYQGLNKNCVINSNDYELLKKQINEKDQELAQEKWQNAKTLLASKEAIEKMKQQYDTDMKKQQTQIEEYKTQLKRNSEKIDFLNSQIQQKEKNFTEQLDEVKRQYNNLNSQKQELDKILTKREQMLTKLQSEFQMKQNELEISRSQVDKLQHNLNQLLSKMNEEKREGSFNIIKKNSIDWKKVSQSIYISKIKCPQCSTILNNTVQNFFEQILEEVQEKKRVDDLEAIKNTLLFNNKVKFCSTKNCTFFCIWQPNLSISYHQGYCLLCSKQTIFSEQPLLNL